MLWHCGLLFHCVEFNWFLVMIQAFWIITTHDSVVSLLQRRMMNVQSLKNLFWQVTNWIDLMIRDSNNKRCFKPPMVPDDPLSPVIIQQLNMSKTNQNSRATTFQSSTPSNECTITSNSIWNDNRSNNNMNNSSQHKPSSQYSNTCC